MDTKVNLRDLVKEKNDFQQTYRTLTKSNVQNKLQIANQRRQLASATKFSKSQHNKLLS